jgi:hypothetical protein
MSNKHGRFTAGPETVNWVTNWLNKVVDGYFQGSIIFVVGSGLTPKSAG